MAKVHVRAKKTVDVLSDITGMLSLELHFYPREVSVGRDVNLQLTAPEHPYVFWLLDTGKIRMKSLYIVVEILLLISQSQSRCRYTVSLHLLYKGFKPVRGVLPLIYMGLFNPYS